MKCKPSGPKTANIMLVGEAPGATEEQIGRPFVGGAGMLLDKILNESLISRSECYITNVMMERPVKNNFKEFYNGKEPAPLLLEGYQRLAEEIKQVNPNVIVALGNEALKALTGENGISKYRGSTLPCSLVSGYKVIAAIHPAAIMRMYDWMPLTIFDFTKAKRESEFKEIRKKKRVYEKITDTEALRRYVRGFIDSGLPLSFDIETCNNQISCIGFSNDPSFAVVVPIHMFDKSFWSKEQEMYVWKLIRELLEAPLPKIAQNANFDCFFLQRTVGIRVANLWMDTMVAFHCVYPELPKGLDTLCSLYTDVPYYKYMIGTDYYYYNSLDCMVTLECAYEIEQELKEFRTWGFYKNIINPIIPILLDMQIKGVKIDLEKMELARLDMQQRVDDLQEKLNKAAGHEVNVNSPKQMKDFFYKDLGLPMKYSRNTGKATTDVKAIKEFAAKTGNIVFDLILKIRSYNKLLGTYLTAKVDDDGRMRCSYLLTGTKSGRLSSRASLTGSGTNLQNVPKGICREIVVPDEGCTFISADLSQAEARIVAYLAGEDRLIDIFESEGDVHTNVASILFDKTPDKVTKGERQLGKRIVHASNYGMGSKTFAEITGLSADDSMRKLQLYHINFPNVKMWQGQVEQQVRRTRVLETPLGRRRVFYGRMTTAMIRDALSYIPQSTVSDIILLAMRQLYENLPSDCHLLLNIHDEVVIQVPKNRDLEKIQKLIIDCMTIPIRVNERLIKIPVNTEQGDSWNEVS